MPNGRTTLSIILSLGLLVAVSLAGLSEDLIVFHAGSLTVPMLKLAQGFEAAHPGVTVAAEASGSNVAARKISELHRDADVMMSADYRVIDQLLIPDYAKWNVQFARNTMVIAYTDRSKYADDITAENWFHVLLRPGVIFGHSDPDLDPCGYRTLMVWQLAEEHYKMPGLEKQLIDACPLGNIRPKAVELLALLQSGDMDYAFEYRSVAVQHGLRFIEFPDEINLSRTEYADLYAHAVVQIAGKEPGETMPVIGAPIVYGVTIPTAAPHQELAIEFVRFLLGLEGQAIMNESGQPSIVPAVVVTGADDLPAQLSALVSEK